MHTNLRWQAVSLMGGIGIIGLGIGWLAGLSLSPVIANIIATVVTAAAAIVAAIGGLEEKAVTPADSTSPAADGNHLPDNSKGVESRIAKTVDAVGRLHVNPWPLAVLFIGLFFGTSAGNWARAHDIFGKKVLPEAPLSAPMLQAEIEPWVTHGISKTLVVQRLFDLKYPLNGGMSSMKAADISSSPSSGPNPYQTGLYALSTAAGQTDCQQIARTSNAELENLVLGEKNPDGSRQRSLQNEVFQELFLALENPDSFRTVVRILCASAL